ncbi:hypothetical protein CEXT_483991 [Caerostris extrusa]|uniref:Uncharacterized protein n=1 Tax=Caerostris extrusa TaxID=172846 RepID=A0AAV4PHH7_CAEEX|nr:hypothetical protein CEXT_483991 [Caerostris extrusa]
MDVLKVIGGWMWVTKRPRMRKPRLANGTIRGTEKGRGGAGGRKAVLKSLSASNQGRLLGVNPSFATAGCRKLLIQVPPPPFPCPTKHLRALWRAAILNHIPSFTLASKS